MWGRGPTWLFPDDLDEDALPAPTVELAVEDLLPRAKVELSVRDRHHHLTAHDLALQVRVAVVLPGAVMAVAGDRFMRGQSFEPAS